MDLLAALDIIRNAPDESLHTHAIQMISTLKDVGKRLQFDLLPHSPVVVDTPPSAESDRSRSPGVPSPFSPVPDSPVSSQQGTLDARVPSITARPNHSSISKTVDSLLKGIERHAYWLLEAQRLEEDAVVSRKRILGGDIRWEDISRVEGIRICDPESKLRRVLALRSLAQEHEDRQTQQGVNPTRLGELCNYVSSPETSTLNLKANHTVKDAFKTRALHSGLRHLTMEKTINAHLEKRQLPGNFLNAVQSMHVPITKGKTKKETTTEETFRPLLPLLRDSSQWFKRLQNKYDLYVSQPLEVDTARQKRPRSDPASFEQSPTLFAHVLTPEPETLVAPPRIQTIEGEELLHHGDVEAVLGGFYHSTDNLIQPETNTNNIESLRSATDDIVIPPDFFDEILAQPIDICASSLDIFGIDDIYSQDPRDLPFPMYWGRQLEASQ
ncbi:hypothetical protein N7492_008291 [Penicillium capsulatum]|uniref:Uncharacterized protein n=1 Tax=Penicillium capsulatum TaxID=69766 RepID=A0A9W9LGS9_9EURO|nr:hypothetical protein N7492_008291 [Penicillium capsulatum]